MKQPITLLNFSQEEHYLPDFVENEESQWLNLGSIEHTNLFCEKNALMEIKETLAERRQSAITFLGSGNYHYVSYLLLSEIKHPFTLVLFDHHTDALPSPSESLISCGSWVLESLQNLSMLEKVIIIGVSEDGREYLPLSISDQVRIYPETTFHMDKQSMMSSILSSIPTERVYISVDKDVLHTNEALTVWDQGSLKLHQLIEMIQMIVVKKRVYGIDICGEYPVNPSNAFEYQTREAIAKNEFANKCILNGLEHVERYAS